MIGEIPYFEVTSTSENSTPFETPIVDQEGFCKRVIDFVEFNLNSNYQIATLCYFVDPFGSVMEATLEHSGYYKSLSKCIEFYESVERYEQCTKIKNIIEDYELF